MKKIGILGTGSVGKTIGSSLIKLGYQVKMGSRTADNIAATEFAQQNGPNAAHGTFADAAQFSSIVINCTMGMASLMALELAGKENLKGKTLIDISNPLDFSKGMPPSLTRCNTDSLAEEIQRTFPETNVIKTLNMVNCEVMVNPKKSGGDPTMFICGNNHAAKEEVNKLLNEFGWLDIIDLGDITNAGGMEMLLPIWVRTFMATKNGYFAFKIIR